MNITRKTQEGKTASQLSRVMRSLQINRIPFLKLANIFVLQWFFIRLTKCKEERIVNFEFTHLSLNPSGNYGLGGRGKVNKYTWYSIQVFILPLSGWWNDFIYLNKKPKLYKITKEKLE